MVNLPRGQEVSGLHGAPSQLQGEILRLVRLDGLSVGHVSITPLKVDLTDHESLGYWAQTAARLSGV
jgi:5'-nucleotidase